MLKLISRGLLLPKFDTLESDYLNYFLRLSFRDYLQKPNSLDNSDFDSFILSIEDQISGGERERLKENLLRTINIRRNYFNDVIKYLNKQDEAKKENHKIINNMEVNKININVDGNNNLINVSKESISQIIKDSNNKISKSDNSEEIKKLIHELIDKVESVINLDLLSDESKQDIVNGLDGFTDQISSEKQNKTKLKEFADDLIGGLKTIGEIGTPLVKLVTDVMAMF